MSNTWARIPLAIVLCALTVTAGAANWWRAAPRAQAQAAGTTTTTSTPTPTASPTPSASPTVTGTPGLPSAASLLAASNAAVTAKDTVHIVGRSVDTVKHALRDVTTSTEDDEYKIPEFRLKSVDHSTDLRKHPPVTKVSSGTGILVGSVSAIRSGHGKWKCLRLPSFSGFPSGSQNPLGSNGDFTEVNLGAETISNIPVWHVRVAGSIPGLTPPGHPMVVDLYINQADDTLVQDHLVLSLAITLKVKGKKVRIVSNGTASDTYSGYGEPLTIKLPKACARTAVADGRMGEFTVIDRMEARAQRMATTRMTPATPSQSLVSRARPARSSAVRPARAVR